MQFSIPLVCVNLPLGASLNAIKDAVADARFHGSGFVDSDEFALFQPKLDSDWGPLHHSLIGFIQSVFDGGWRATAMQHAPTSLVGDFGEYYLAKQYCDAHIGRGARVARVVRAQGLKRPDFVIWDPARSRLTALECKTSIINSANIRQRMFRRAQRSADLTLCSTTKERRNKGLAQVCSKSTKTERAVVLPQRSPLSTPPDRDVTDYNESRVLANRSVVGTLVVPDGRLKQGNTHAPVRVHHPQGCDDTCLNCPAGVSRVHVAFFTNNSIEIRPMLPEDRPELGEEAFRAQLLLARALWCDSTAMFMRGLEDLAWLARSLSRGGSESERLRYAVLVLDAVAAGLEARLVRAEQAFLLLRSGFTGILSAAYTAQLTEAAPTRQDKSATRVQHRFLLSVEQIEQTEQTEHMALFQRLTERTDPEFSRWAERFFVDRGLEAGPRLNAEELLRNARSRQPITGPIQSILPGPNTKPIDGSISRREHAVRLKFSAASLEHGVMLIRALLPDAHVIHVGSESGVDPISGAIVHRSPDNGNLGPLALVEVTGLGYVDLVDGIVEPASGSSEQGSSSS